MTTAQFLEIFEKELKELLTDESLSSPLSQAMRYSAGDGGKRIRPTAVFLGAKTISENFPLDKVLRLAIAIELIHNYSLVHDDLPAMDNDEYRRGKLTVHRQFGEANAILTGDQLLTKAMQILLTESIDDSTFTKAALQIAKASSDMVDGQVYDLSGMKTADEFFNMYKLKTGALFVGAFSAGAIVADATSLQLQNIVDYAEHVGLAFQLADDLLDEGEYNSLAAVLGREETTKLLVEQTEKACIIAKQFYNSDELQSLASLLATRDR